jgi:hypothetical protein
LNSKVGIGSAFFLPSSFALCHHRRRPVLCLGGRKDKKEKGRGEEGIHAAAHAQPAKWKWKLEMCPCRPKASKMDGRRWMKGWGSNANDQSTQCGGEEKMVTTHQQQQEQVIFCEVSQPDKKVG